MKIKSAFWFKNEKDVLKKLGLKPQPGSGNGMKKEDGENEFALCQLKSTNAEQILIKEYDIEKLCYHANEINKVPIFVIQFLNRYTLIATIPSEVENLSKLVKTGKINNKANMPVIIRDEQSRKQTIISEVTKYDDLKANLNQANESGTKQEPQTFLEKAKTRRENLKNKRW